MQISVGHQLLQLCGALMILFAYVGHQLRWMDSIRPTYNLLNGVGSGILAFYAVWPRVQPGFVVLEATWAVISLYALVRGLRSRQTVAE